MTSFTIDDVRETMPAEVIKFLGDIETTGQNLLAQPALCAIDCWQPARELLRTIAARAHAISGTSMLVSANALASCSRLLERLVSQCDTEIREARERASRARRAIELLPAGVKQMREVLQLELDHNEDEAQWTTVEWQRDVDLLLAELGELKTLVAKPHLGPTTSIPPCLTDSDVPPSATELDIPKAEARNGANSLAGETPPDEPKEDRSADSDGGAGNEAKSSELTGVGASTPAAPLSLDLAGDEADSVSEISFGDLEEEEPIRPPAHEGDGGREVPAPPAGGTDVSCEADDEFSFAEPVVSEGLTRRTQADVVQELKGVFQQEARESVVALQGHVAALVADPTNRQLVIPIERIYHTLKGAAATIGLADVSIRAADLQSRSERAAIDGITRPGLDALVRDTNEMLSLAGLEGIALTAPPQKAPAAVASRTSPAEQAIRRVFVAEAAQLHEEASGLVDALSRAADGTQISSVLAQLEPLFHRLKGSALVAGEEEVANSAISLKNACKASPPPTTAELSLGLARIAAKLGLNRAKAVSAPAAPDDSSTVAATRAAFELEARQIVDEALTRLQAPASNTDASQTSVRQELGALLHRLKGSARVVGDEGVAEEARALEQMVGDSDGDVRAAPPEVHDRLLALRSRLGSPSSMMAHSSEAAAAAAPRRERVELTAPDELWETFTLECAELLENIERAALGLEDSASPKDQLRPLMRLVHTLKGVVNTTGLAPTGRMLHRLEDFLELLLKAPILPPMRMVVSLLLGAQEQVRKNLREARSGWVETYPEQLERRITAALSGQQDRGSSAPQRESKAAPSASERSDLSSAKSSPTSEMSEAHDRRVIRVATDRLDALMNLAGELVVNRSRLNSRVERLQVLQSELTRGSLRLLETVDAFRDEYEFSNLDGRRVLALTGTDDRGFSGGAEAAPQWGSFGELELDRYESIHVLTRRLAELTSDFSEIHGQLSRGLAALTDDSDVVGGIVTGIQSEVTRARMVPLEMLFLRLRLPLRDAAVREQKEVRDIVRGEDVPIDKTIADALFQPMLHLVRNAVVHGIESPAQRAKCGKDRAGTVELSARQESGQIVVEVRDDGAGLDLPALLARGIAMGILPAGTAVDDPRVKDMVFVPGLTTRAAADDVAGRGVGGDVVKRTVDRLHGSMLVESTSGVGTVFSIRLPLTLAITRALIVRQGKQSFAVPLHFAERIIDSHEQEVTNTGDVRRVKVEGMLLPIRDLGEFLRSDAKSESGPVVILRVGDKRLALQIDGIVAQEDIVVKSLGSILTGHPVFAGVNIRGNGELVLILDIPSLVEGRGTWMRAAASSDQDKRPAPNDENAQKASPRAREPERAAPSRPARVLFVDDSLSVRKVAEMQLRELGVEVTVATDGLDALAKLREREFDIVFTDLEMPRMHGYELIRELRFLPAFRDLPIVVVSSRSGQKHQDQARQLGANEYLTKPFTVQMLGGAIKKWVSGGNHVTSEPIPSEGAARE